MEIVISRRWRGINSTVSSVTVDGQAHHFILEDRDRGLKSDMPLADIAREKVYGKTAIPTGRYQIAVTYSNRFKRLLPLLVNVPGFAGIRIHPGNRHIDTEGCLLPGKGYSKEELEYVVTNSRTSCDVLFLKINEALKNGEEVWCTIIRTYK